jgi:deoxyribonucleoside regulator
MDFDPSDIHSTPNRRGAARLDRGKAKRWMQLRRQGWVEDDIRRELSLSPSEAEELVEILSEAYEMARLLIEENLPQDRIARLKGVARGTVASRLALAREVEILCEILVPPVARYSRAARLQRDLKERFLLKDVLLVEGHHAMLQRPLDPSERSPVFQSAVRAAADYLDEHLKPDEVLCLAWGAVVHGIVESFRSTRSRSKATVVPMLGALAVRQSPLEANVLAHQMAAALQAPDVYWLSFPAIIRDPRLRPYVADMPLVREALAQIRRSTFVVTSLAPPNPNGSTLVRQQLLEPHEIQQVKDRGAVGEICAWWYDEQGCDVKDERIWPLGLGLEGLRRIVASGRGSVMAVVFADKERILPLLAAIRGRLVNVIVTDHVTAEVLLQRSAPPEQRPYRR